MKGMISEELLHAEAQELYDLQKPSDLDPPSPYQIFGLGWYFRSGAKSLPVCPFWVKVLIAISLIIIAGAISTGSPPFPLIGN